MLIFLLSGTVIAQQWPTTTQQTPQQWPAANQQSPQQWPSQADWNSQPGQPTTVQPVQESCTDTCQRQNREQFQQCDSLALITQFNICRCEKYLAQLYFLKLTDRKCVNSCPSNASKDLMLIAAQMEANRCSKLENTPDSSGQSPDPSGANNWRSVVGPSPSSPPGIIQKNSSSKISCLLTVIVMTMGLLEFHDLIPML